MRSYLQLVVGLCILVLLFGCQKDKDNLPPATTGPVISNLQYSPNTVIIKPGLPNFVVTGTLDFDKASGGISAIRLTSNHGMDITVPLPDNNNSQGIIQGTFEFTMPSSPLSINFEVWIVDKKGQLSNKLSGNIEVVIDDSGVGWMMVSRQWELDKVVWANNQFMAVGQHGEILSSSNGRQWSTRNSGVSQALFGIAFSNNLWVVTGSFGTILTSSDGVNWQRQTSGAEDAMIMGVSRGNNIWVAVGYKMQSERPVVLVSSDAITWAPVELAANFGKLNAIVWANGIFVGVGKKGTPYITTSTNGIQWTAPVSTDAFEGELVDIIYTGNGFAAIGFQSAATSTDGLVWKFAPAFNMGLTGLCFTGRHFLAVGITGVYRSDDGLGYTRVTDLTQILRSVAWSGTSFVAVGFISPSLMVSPQ